MQKKTKTDVIKVGIVTPTHNSSATIEKTLNSILEQSYRDFDVYVVDDHSTDNTLEIVKKICKKDNRVHLVQLEKEKGAAAARNLAIKCIEDDPEIKYVAFLDSDDLWRKKKLKTQVVFMRKNKIAFSYGDYDVYNDKTQKIYKRRISPAKMSYSRMLIGCSVGCLTVMYDKEAVGHISIPNLKKRNDYALWCIILKKVRRGLKYPGVLAIYNRGQNGISSGGKVHLIKYHYRMHRNSNHFNPITAGIFTTTNIINYFTNISLREKKYNKSKD